MKVEFEFIFNENRIVRTNSPVLNFGGIEYGI